MLELCAAELFEKEVFQNSSDEYDVVKVSVKFVCAYEHSQKHRKKEIFNDGMREGLSAKRACKILNHQWLTGDVSYYCVLYYCSLHIGAVIHPLHYLQVINAYSSFLSRVVGGDRHIMPTWLVNWLLEFRPDTEPEKNENEVVANHPIATSANVMIKLVNVRRKEKKDTVAHRGDWILAICIVLRFRYMAHA